MRGWPGLLVVLGAMAGCSSTSPSSTVGPNSVSSLPVSAAEERGSGASQPATTAVAASGEVASGQQPPSRPEPADASPWASLEERPPGRTLAELTAARTGPPDGANRDDLLAPLPSVHLLVSSLRSPEMDAPEVENSLYEAPAGSAGDKDKIVRTGAVAQAAPAEEPREDVHPSTTAECTPQPPAVAQDGGASLTYSAGFDFRSGASLPPAPAETAAAGASTSLPPLPASPSDEIFQIDREPTSNCQYEKEAAAPPREAGPVKEPAGAPTASPEHPCARLVGSIETEPGEGRSTSRCERPAPQGAGGTAQGTSAASGPVTAPPGAEQQTQSKKVALSADPPPAKPAELPSAACEGHPKSAPLVRLVNCKRFSLDFEVKDAGPSGVSGVDLWYTQDGRTWKKYAAAPRQKSPYVIEVPDEDFYGFTLVAHSGAGRSKQPPQTGDLPQVWVGVDETKPTVRLLGVEVGMGRQIGTLTILWTASDKHLAAQPITLSFAEKSDGPWTQIASGLKNTGSYIWRMPPGTPNCFFIRVEAVDLVGNVGIAQTPEPLFGDGSQPNVAVLTVAPVTKLSEPAVGR